MFLDAIYRRRDGTDATRFPWALPLLKRFERLEFTAAVTFLVGENGSGKSTPLEGIATAANAVAMGAADLARDPTLDAARAVARGLRCARRHHPRTKMFLRAEDVFGYTQRLVREMAELPAGEAAKLAARYGADPDARSHGETFLALLETRLVPQGLYFLDEPEAPLSPTRSSRCSASSATASHKAPSSSSRPIRRSCWPCRMPRSSSSRTARSGGPDGRRSSMSG